MHWEGKQLGQFDQKQNLFEVVPQHCTAHPVLPLKTLQSSELTIHFQDNGLIYNIRISFYEVFKLTSDEMKKKLYLIKHQIFKDKHTRNVWHTDGEIDIEIRE